MTPNYGKEIQYNNNFGLQLNIAISENFSFRTELQYVKRKLDAKCLYIPNEDEAVTHIFVRVVDENCNHSAKGTYSFIRLPLSIRYIIKTSNPRFKFYSGIGISPLIKLRNKYRIISEDSNGIYADNQGKFEIQSWLSIQSFVGISYNFSENMIFSIEPTYFTDDLRSFIDDTFGIKFSLSRTIN